MQTRVATPRAKLDEALAVLSDKAPAFMRLGAIERAALLRSCMPRLESASRRWVEAGCKAKGLAMDSPAACEEWLAGPVVTMRTLRLYIKSLEEIHRYGKPQLLPDAFRTGWDGRTEVRIFPEEAMDKVLFGGFSCYLRMQPGLTAHSVREQQAAHYQRNDNHPGVSLILGAGNASCIPPTNALHKLVVDGKVCVVKLNPVNEYLGPFYEQVFAPLIERGYLRFVYGGAEIGAYLSHHPLIEDVHITGSDRTHDLIVWGPPGLERDRRQRMNDPVLKKNITSELGCVTPVMIVPADYSPAELRFIAENVATQVVINASFCCNAAKILVTSAGWRQRDAFAGLLRQILAATPLRRRT
jgi:aldehyde dehydrogenase (NAD(P)+)